MKNACQSGNLSAQNICTTSSKYGLKNRLHNSYKWQQASNFSKDKRKPFYFKIFGLDVEFKSWITICFQKTSISWQNLWIFRLKAWGWISSFLQCSSNYWWLRASLTANLWFTLCYFLIKSLLKISQSQINDYSVISLSKKTWCRAFSPMHSACLLCFCTETETV